MATNDQYESRTVEAELFIGKVKIPINSVSLRHTIDELPYAEVTVQLDNLDTVEGSAQGSVGINVEKFRRMAQLFQEKILNEFRVNPDVKLIVKDGNEDGRFTLTFNGFLGKPEVVIQEGQVLIKVGVVHAKAALQAWNGQIYNYVEPYVLPHLVDAFGEAASSDAQSAAKDGTNGKSISMKVLALVEYMMKAVDMVPTPDDLLEFDMMPIHMLNKKSYEIVKKVLKDSAATTEIDGLADDEFDPGNLYEILFETLRNSPNFWAVLQQLGHIFLFQTNADWAGNLWLEPIQSVQDGPQNRMIRVPLAQIRFNVAHLYELPIQQVIVVGEGMDLYVLSGAMGLNQGEAPLAPVPVAGGQYYSGRVPKDGELWVKMQGLAKYPPAVDRTLAGNFYVLQAPPWINSDTIIESQIEQLRQGLDTTDDRWMQYIQAQPNLQDAFLKSNKPRRKLLSYMAQQLFNSLYLGSTYASITVPFDLRPCVGRRYSVADLNGTALFEGFLKDVYHTVSLNADGASDASTTMTFTHIVVAGANLKQLVAVKEPATTMLAIDITDKTMRSPSSVPPENVA